MKRVTALFLSLFMAFVLYGQNDTIPVPGDLPEIEEQNQDLELLEEEMEELEEQLEELEEKDVLFETPDKTEVSFGENEVFIIEESGDTTIVGLGNKGVSIVEGKDGTAINIIEMDDDSKIEKKKKSKAKFRPHYAGLELGLNNFLTPEQTLPAGTFMNLNTSKSWNWNLNFLEYGFGLGTSYVGLVTGMGLEWSNYVFDANNTIEEDVNGNIINVPDPFPDATVTKSSLKTTYLSAPLLLEFQIPAGKKRIHISGGVIGGVKLGSKTKVKYNDGNKQKSVIKDDYSLSPFKYGATVRIGYRMINLYANYYFSPLFSETSTPELYPFSVGINLIPF